MWEKHAQGIATTGVILSQLDGTRDEENLRSPSFYRCIRTHTPARTHARTHEKDWKNGERRYRERSWLRPRTAHKSESNVHTPPITRRKKKKQQTRRHNTANEPRRTEGESAECDDDRRVSGWLGLGGRRTLRPPSPMSHASEAS